MLVADTHLILTRPDGAVLFLLRQGTGYMDGYASLVAGHVEADEAADVATVREAKEEVGVIVEPDGLRFAHVMHRHAPGEPGSRVSWFFTASSWIGDPANMEPDKCAGLFWCDPADLSGLGVPVVPYVAEALACISRGEGFSANGWR
ncbi:NUDIX domain-containing protein [Actinocorallia sp. API 0066]|uniref:NUDIX hydrolase n=1 Tax=Actinocorallia sp. API 0066 TaxID=2896846 RepID=UPI001E35D085|nr:NUDIX domain-containing protein [Actinocorallia sp. API 0066]MCD0453351.1 NUDIX domain-containing protein [Actinocorallia sp. API 0066]